MLHKTKKNVLLADHNRCFLSCFRLWSMRNWIKPASTLARCVTFVRIPVSRESIISLRDPRILNATGRWFPPPYRVDESIKNCFLFKKKKKPKKKRYNLRARRTQHVDYYALITATVVFDSRSDDRLNFIYFLFSDNLFLTSYWIRMHIYEIFFFVTANVCTARSVPGVRCYARRPQERLENQNW